MEQYATIATADPVRVLGLLVGNIKDPASDAAVKYGSLFRALAAHTSLIDVCDVELRGVDRYQNALRTMRWPKHRWREAFHKNIWGFGQRSRLAQRYAQQYQHRADVILQHGTIFSAGIGSATLPTVIYTDFTYRLLQREDPWRNPFSPAESERWNDLETMAAQRAAFVLTRSEYTRRSMINDYGIDPARVVAVGGGVNFAELPEIAPPAAAPRILFIGMDFERKGGPQLVAAFNQVRQRIPDAELWMITANTDCTGPGIRHVPPTHNRAEIEALYRAASLFAMPSRCETWGDVFLEAMAYGLPCIGTTNDAMPEIIEHGVSGYVVAPDDVAGLADHLDRLLSDATLRRSMGARGRERVEQTFTWDHVARRMVPFLRDAKESYGTLTHSAAGR